MNVVLVHPEIPQNTGNIARTCAATGAVLHLVKPLGFEISDKYLKRAGLDYWHLTTLKIHESLEEFLASCPEGARLWFCTTKAARDYCEISYGPEDYLLFGRETRGLPEDLLAGNYAKCVRIPMRQEARSLNLSNSVAIVLYEALRQQNFPGLVHEGRLSRPVGEWRDYL